MTESQLAKQTAEKVSAFAEPTRLRIITLLQSGERTVTEIATELGVEIVNVSHHLKVLRVSGILVDEKRGRFVVYLLNPTQTTFATGKSTTIDCVMCRVTFLNSTR